MNEKMNIKEKTKDLFNRVWSVCKDRRTVVLFICVVIVVYSPVWGGYLLYAIFGWKWCAALASACVAFWAGPFTPFFPLCIGVTLSIKKVAHIKNKKLSPKDDDAVEQSFSDSTDQVVPTGEKQLTYDKLFWLFILGSILGVIIEGVFCLVTRGHWESHVVSVIGAFNILYGLGAVLFYVGAVALKEKHIAIRTLIMTLAATVLELLCGLLLKNSLGMRAWNYENHFMNYKGLICIGFSLAWGLAAFAFCLLYPRINLFLDKFKGRGWHIACVAMSIFMAFNLYITAVSIVRWSERHYGIAATSSFETDLDTQMPDEWMQARFMDWQFLA